MNCRYCGETVDLDDPKVLIQYSFTEEHSVWCSRDHFHKTKDVNPGPRRGT